ncbi:MAG: PorT family protein [Saprospiraceae bacterium]|nr:PorT family protein [Saprospiraceae bacterium]
MSRFDGILMIRFILIISFLLFVVMPSSAQRFKGHLVAGFNLAQIDGDRLAGYHKIGANVGLGVATVLSERWQISTSFAFSQLGTLRTRNDDPASIYDKITLNTVEVPVMVHLLDWKFHFKAGLVYNRLIDYNVIDVLGEDITDLNAFQQNNVAAMLGFTYFWNEHWGFDFRWAKAITDLESNPDNSNLLSKWISFKTMYVF